MLLVSIVVVMVMVVVSISGGKLKEKIDTVSAKEAHLEKQIESEEARQQEIEEYKKYTQTKKYAEEVAKDKLGLVYEGEILFQEK